MVYRVEVAPRVPDYPDSEGEAVLSDIRELGVKSVHKVRVVKVYKLEGKLPKKTVQKIACELLVERLWQDYSINSEVIKRNAEVKVVEVALKPGVMNTEIDSIKKAVSDMGVKGLITAGSGKKYYFYGNPTDDDLSRIANKLLVNNTIEQVLTKPEDTLLIGGKPEKSKIIPIRSSSDGELLTLSKDKLWLTLEEMRAIVDYFKKEGRDSTDAELETIAQTWSEHCYHKTFKSILVVDGKRKKPLIQRIKEATKKINSKYAISVFEDNAGVIQFNKDWAICGKVETHNSPSAIEPYGGAATGTGGVFRDIISTGLGAKIIASTDIFCFAPPDFPDKKVPKGCLHPRRLLKGVVRGVKDYGNRMGIPTNNGSVYFDPDFRAKPTVIVGAYGIMPKKFSKIGKPTIGDLILVVGGKTGRDGIHGATFSSGEMTERTETISSQAVQIGNAIEQKRMSDALLVCRDKGYIRMIQDCGGGGLSSAVGEIAKKLGCVVWLEKVPLKYSGLSPWEIWISESQEREIVVIDPANLENVRSIFQLYNVPWAKIGMFTKTSRLVIRYEKDTVLDLDMHFLHNGVPLRMLKGEEAKNNQKEPLLPKSLNFNKTLTAILSSWNVCSKEPIVRLYDHEVQGTSVVKPFVGVNSDGPSDAAVIEPILGEKTGMAIAHGMHPTYNRINPYWGTASAIDEAVRNLVAVGVDPSCIALIDNFIFPKPGKEEIWQLDRAVDALYDLSVNWKMPFVSGKDSLSSTYRGENGEVIKIPPVICISAFAPVDDIHKMITSDFKQAGNLIYIVGETFNELGGSEYYRLFNKKGVSVPKVNIEQALQIFDTVHSAIQKGFTVSAHDCSDGGLAVTLAEMCFGGNLGATINLDNVPGIKKINRADFCLFSESNSRFIVEIPVSFEKQFKTLFKNIPFGLLGTINAFPVISVSYQNNLLIKASITELKKIWKYSMQTVFN